jgi:mono/diheme cytochrome c family protein
MRAAALATAVIVAFALVSSAHADQALFRQKCGMCHLAGGTGTFMLERRLGADKALLEKRRDLDARLAMQAVRSGIVSMPRFTRAELTDDQLESIAAYLSKGDTR